MFCPSGFPNPSSFDARTVNWGLTAQLLQHLGGSGKSVTRLADRDVQDELLDLQLAHGVARLVLAGSHDIRAIGLLLRGLSLGLHMIQMSAVVRYPSLQFPIPVFLLRQRFEQP